MQLAIEGGFDVTELKQDINFLNVVSDLNNEIEIHREFINHFNNNNVKEYLVTHSQEKHFSDGQCNNLLKVCDNLQIKLSKLRSQFYLEE